MSAEADCQVLVSVTRNQDPGDTVRQFYIPLSARSDGLIWGVDEWGVDTWVSSGAASSSELKRGKPLCHAYSVQFRIDGPSEPVRWGMDSISVPYIPRALR